eukprot:g54806.t1
MTDLIQQFKDVTGCNESLARSLLEDSGWDLDVAVSNFLATSEEEMPSSGSSSNSAFQDGVRAPDAVRHERLFEPLPQIGLAGGAPRGSGAVVADPFRNYQQEQEQQPFWSEKGLQHLFAPPADLLFRGSFEEARQTALVTNKWLLVNLQDRGDFQSHQLNRDTWKSAGVQDVTKQHCIFWQRDHLSQEGKQYCAVYHVNHFPHIGIIHPLTKAKLAEWTGFVQPKPMVAALAEFFGSQSERPGLLETSPQARRDRAKEAADLELQAAVRASMQFGKAKSPLDMTDEERLQAALRASLQDDKEDDVEVLSVPSEPRAKRQKTSSKSQSHVLSSWPHTSSSSSFSSSSSSSFSSSSSSPPPPPPSSSSSPPPPPPPPSPSSSSSSSSSSSLSSVHTSSSNSSSTISSTTGAATSAPDASPSPALSLPPEPPVGAPDSTRLQLQLPSGRKLQRRFVLSARVATVREWAASSLGEEAPASFRLLVRRPAGQARLDNLDQTLQQAQLRGCSVLVEL